MAKFLTGNCFNYTGGGDIGTGPGVIPMDGFTPGYSANMGRAGRNMNMMMHPNQSELLALCSGFNVGIFHDTCVI